MAKIISFCNQKGGVGKTTTTINLGITLAKMGKKVMMIDFDPQGNLTMALGFHNPDEIPVTISTIMQNIISTNEAVGYKAEDYILKVHGIDLVPANITLANIENILINTMSRENILKRFIKEYEDNYDYILIDCLPSLNILTVNALNASDEVIIPVQAQYLSVKGLEMLLDTILKVISNLNPTLEIGGVLITMLDRRSNFQDMIIQTIKETYGEDLHIFKSIIPLSVKVSENQSKGLSIMEEKNNQVAKGYEQFAKEVANV